MIAILPIRIRDDDAVWHSPEGRETIANLLRSLAPLAERMRFVVMGDQPFVAAVCQELSLEMLDLPPGPDMDAPLPLGTGAAVARLRSQADGLGNALGVLNFRNPMLTPEIVVRAEELHRHGQAPVLGSFRETRDHPCQFNLFFEYIDVGAIRVQPDLDKAFAQAGLGELLAQAYAAVTPGAVLVGAAFEWDETPRPPLLFHCAGDKQYHLYYPQVVASQRSFAVKALPSGPAGPLPGKCFELRFRGPRKTVSFAMEQPLVSLHHALMAVVEDDECDCTEPCHSPDSLWAINYQNMDRINLHTGNLIAGRQDFPRVIRLDGSLFVIGESRLGRIGDPALFEEMAPLILSELDSHIVATAFDLVRCRIRLAMRANAGRK
jgi:hypothetical protein